MVNNEPKIFTGMTGVAYEYFGGNMSHQNVCKWTNISVEVDEYHIDPIIGRQ